MTSPSLYYEQKYRARHLRIARHLLFPRTVHLPVQCPIPDRCSRPVKCPRNVQYPAPSLRNCWAPTVVDGARP